ncbi:MAG: PhoU domain-containing protein [Rhodothermaceae bacterium]
MERVFDTQMEKIKTKLIKICSLVDEQFELIHESFKQFDENKLKLIFEKEEEIAFLKGSVERNCSKIFVLTQPVANDLRDVLLFLKINLLFKNYGNSILALTKLVEKHSKFEINFELTEIYESTYYTLDIMKSSFDAFIVNDVELAERIISSEANFVDMIDFNIRHLMDAVKDQNGNLEAVLNIHTILNELKHIYNYSSELCEDVLILNGKKDPS